MKTHELELIEVVDMLNNRNRELRLICDVCGQTITLRNKTIWEYLEVIECCG